jgi:hypothetical protein
MISISKPIGAFFNLSFVDRAAIIFPDPQPRSKIFEFLFNFFLIKNY